MKGRNTTCVTIRLEDSVVKSLDERAKKQGSATAGEYIKAQILKSLNNHSEITNTIRALKHAELQASVKLSKVKPVSEGAKKAWREYKKG